ncbi:MAG: sporulation protein YunB [Oscillospiraceae bacterium]|nr:sporulation protein YunB [Oscillospiraceae bacterium]
MRLGIGRRRTKGSALTSIFFVLLILAILFFAVLIRLQPAFLDYAASYANNMANSIVNESINKVFSNELYSNLTEVSEKSESGIKTLSTDTIKINKLKAELNREIQDNIKNFQSETVNMPLGSATNLYFLAGMGPQIPIRIYPMSMLNTDFREEFDSAGINQVYHRLYLDVSLEMSFVGLTFSENETITTSALLSETVIVGDTPEYYGGSGIGALME